MRTLKIISTVFCCLLLLVNCSFLRYFLPQTYPHTYCADGGGFYTVERALGHHTLASVEMAFIQYKAETHQPDLVLYRCFRRKWWQIWNWADFLTAPRWNYPYAGHGPGNCAELPPALRGE